jgi:hypothetical protein
VADPGYGAGTAEGRQWRLVLSAPARKLVIFFIVFVAMGVSVVNAIQAANSVSTLTTTLEVTAATVPVRATLNDYSSQLTACHGELTCVTSLDRTMANALTTYGDVLQAISVPSPAAAAKARLITTASSTAATFAELGAATSASQYDSTLRSSGVVREMAQLGTAYDNLISALAS